MKKIACKNTNCKHYYKLSKGEHCKAEEYCSGHMTNRKKADKQRVRCKGCEYCKKIYTEGMTEYHYECTVNKKRKIILMVESRVCDCKL